VGNDIVGIVHPCKVYGAMAVARPVLLLGPRPCHITDLLDSHGVGWQVHHGDVEGMEALVRRVADTPREELSRIGLEAQRVIEQDLSKGALCGRFCDIIERGMRPRTAEAPAVAGQAPVGNDR
jgi:putative colanic acid biosynthesis glycosyltransferase WcaI